MNRHDARRADRTTNGTSNLYEPPVLPPHLQRIAHMLDDRFRIPGTEMRFGYDGLVGLIPGFGDTLTAAMGAYIVWEARRLGAPSGIQAKMVGNLVFDWLIGLVPLIGDLADFGFKAHRKNLALLEGHLRTRTAAASATARPTATS